MATYLFAWNPKKWEWTDLEQEAERVQRRHRGSGRWSCARKTDLPKGSPFMLIRLGAPPTGIIGWGETTSDPRKDTHWDGSGRKTNYVDIRYRDLRVEPLITWSELQKPPFSRFRWGIQSSGIRIPEDLAVRLHGLWEERSAAVSSSAHSDLAIEFESALLATYQRAGEEVGYWGRRFKQAIANRGGVATVRRMLTPRGAAQRAGLDKLLEAGRPDLTVEAVVLQPHFKRLFTEDERRVARERLEGHQRAAKQHAKHRERLYPDELEPGRQYTEGLRRQVRVNAYERDSRARKACLRHHGYRCSVCSVLLSEVYGDIANGFIHVHHVVPISRIGEQYKVDPIRDLRPVCPNCHGILHRQKSPLSIAAGRKLLKK